MKRLVSALLGGRLQYVLIASFALVAALTVSLNALVVSRVINQYLVDAQSNRVARDMNLARAFYQLKQDEITAIGHRITQDPDVYENLPSLSGHGNDDTIQVINHEISRKITVPMLGGTHLIAILDPEGNTLAARVLAADGSLSSLITQGSWGDLPIVADVLATGKEHTATEVIPAELLTTVGLDEQAEIPLIDTPKAAPEPFDPREGTAGLALTGVYPIGDNSNQLFGAVLVAHLFNNDFTLVDRIKEVAGVDTATIFFGDLRVSTNVPDETGARAVGTRVSAEVNDVVLKQGQEYKGEAFVVKEPFITRYEPLRDYLGQVVGSLYIGARLSSFERLVYNLNSRVAMIALISIGLAAIIAVPIARLITRPVSELVQAHQRLAKGDMTVRVQTSGNGELAILGRSFNSMVETLDRAQQDLLHKEKLASMGQLAAGVAHEINNPLGTILLFSDVLYNETPNGDPRRKDLQMIIDEAMRCKRIVSDLLNFSRQQEMLAQDTNLHELIENVIQEVRHQPAYNGVELVCYFSPETITIQADPAQLQQVFINLLNNAAESITGKGKITITTQMVNNHWMEIKVSDTGCGIPEENIGKLFTPFFTTKALGRGTGLGLSIVYGIIKMHRGQISVESREGQGTTVTVTLPVHLPGGEKLPSNVHAEVIG